MGAIILSMDPVMPLLEIVRSELHVAHSVNEDELCLDESDEEAYIVGVANLLLNDSETETLWDELPPVPTYALDAMIEALYRLLARLLTCKIIAEHRAYRYHIDHINEILIICEE